MIETSRSGAIATLTIRRAEKKNAVNEAMWRSLLVHCQRIQAEVAADPRSARRDQAPRC